MPQLRLLILPRRGRGIMARCSARVHQRRMAIMTLEREFIDLLTLGVKDQGAGFVERRVSLARRLLRLHSLVGSVDCTYEF